MEVNCVLIGDELVGKTTISRNYSSTFIHKHTYTPTQGLDIYRKQIALNHHSQHSTAISLYDISGSMTKLASILHETNIIILVYDVQNYASFVSLKKWVKLINRAFFKLENNCSPLPLHNRLPLIAIFGNKTDLVNTSSVPQVELKRFAEEIHASVYHVCAYSGSGIDEAFSEIVSNFTVVDKGSAINTKQQDLQAMREKRRNLIEQKMEEIDIDDQESNCVIQ